MTKCKVIDLTPFDSGSDSDFIHACKRNAISVHTASVSVSSFYNIKFLLQRKLFYRTRVCCSNAP